MLAFPPVDRPVARLILLVFIGSAILLAPGCRPRYGQVTVGNEHGRVSVSFSAHDRKVIRHYYRQNMPPGLAKKGGRPPGLAKKRVLPSSVRTYPLPAKLKARLSPLPDGYLRVQVGTNVVLMERDSHLILDVVHAIHRSR